jgi:hypothetical protein
MGITFGAWGNAQYTSTWAQPLDLPQHPNCEASMCFAAIKSGSLPIFTIGGIERRTRALRFSPIRA